MFTSIDYLLMEEMFMNMVPCYRVFLDIDTIFDGLEMRKLSGILGLSASIIRIQIHSITFPQNDKTQN